MSARGSALLLGLAAVLALLLGLDAAGNALTRSGGLLTLLLPWAGAAVYSALAVLAARRPASPWLRRGIVLAAFVQAALLMELLVERRPCAACLAVAALAGLGAWALAAGRSVEAGPLGAAAALGAVLGSLAPFDAADAAATRVFWPARILARAPDFVDPRLLAGCEHPSEVRILIYEKDCKG